MEILIFLSISFFLGIISSLGQRSEIEYYISWFLYVVETSVA